MKKNNAIYHKKKIYYQVNYKKCTTNTIHGWQKNKMKTTSHTYPMYPIDN